jgi:cysteine-rich repeat protein
LVFGLVSDADVPALSRTAKQSLSARPCDSMHLYQAAFDVSGHAKFLFNAAEAAMVAGDRAQARSHYRRILASFPRFSHRALTARRLAFTEDQIRSDGPGRSCPAKPARCGDAYIDEGETCDDGGRAAGDGCDARCARESGG